MSELSDDPDEAFAEFLFLTEIGEAPDFEDFCACFHGDVAELRGLHADWCGLSDVLSDGRPDASGLDAVGALRSELEERTTPSQRYDRKEELARGGMGAIYRVWDRDLGRHLAMKVMLSPAERGGAQRPDSASRQLSRFLEEAKVTGQLDHPGIVSVHDLGVDEVGRCFFTMQLVRGIDFKEVLARIASGDPDWTLQRALQVLLRLCDALGYAHSKGVIHRDLKPANIMVGRFGEVYVMDWGLARIQGEPDVRDLRLRVDAQASDEVRGVRDADEDSDSPVLTMDGHIVGTPAYISPEQAQGRVDELGPRSDVYSLGATLYHLLCGSAPYTPPGQALGAQRVLLLALQGPPRPVEQLAPDKSLELAAICGRAMQRDPQERYASAQELGEDLRAFLEGGVVQAYRGGALWELRKWIARNTALAGAILIATALAFAFAVNESLELADENRALQDAGREARAGERVAVAERDVQGETTSELVRNLRASDEVLLDELTRAAQELPPPSPASAERHLEWLRSARSMHGRLELHSALLDELREANAEDWELRPLAHLIDQLEHFGAGISAPLTRVESRAALAQTILADSLESLEARAAWATAGVEIAASESYAELTLTPQLGLLPLGADPASGLQEFAALTTGAAPRRDESGSLLLDAQSAVVLVLIPAQSFFMGAQATDRSAPNFDANAEPSEAPVHEVQLDAQLIAKHELNRAQWARISGAPNPSLSESLLPARNLSWSEAERALRSVGLVLPDEAAWEAAARAGSDTPWWTGASAASLDGAANIEADGSLPIYSGRANANGLIQVHGNVAEWCAGAPRAYASDLLPAAAGARVFRGGSYLSAASNSRSADRYAADMESRSADRGLRAACVRATR